MLLLHQTGSVKVGEIVRYTLTYTPSQDRILPPPTHLHVKIKNTSAVPLRAAYLHGPYTIYVAGYPATYDPSKNHTKDAATEGAPDFEPQLKAGGHWHSKLTVPEEVRKDADQTFFKGQAPDKRKSFTWIIEIASQVLFSTTAAVHFELLVGRDAKSIELGFYGVAGSGQGAPGKLEDHQQGRSRNLAQPKGVFSKAVRLAVDDTESLWNTPAFPHKDDQGKTEIEQPPQHGDKRDAGAKEKKTTKKQKKIHLVLLSHGLHSNLGADMLYMKESIDAATRQAKESARQRKTHEKVKRAAAVGGRSAHDDRTKSAPELAVSPTEKQLEDEGESDSDDEETLVRGFNGNAVKTEKGLQYLGKRFAKYVLLITYPNQPYLPVKSSISKSITRSLTGSKLGKNDKSKERKPSGNAGDQHPIHKNSTIMKDEKHTQQKDDLPYRITSISFIGHSLGGLVQTYAIAYIQKHSPDFFDLIKPVNFVALATPFLGLSNENPMYVKFALDFGLVGRTGQDLGLTWRAPTFAKNSWTTMISGLGVDTQKDKQEPNPSSKPLLRILPTGPAHVALKKFQHRTVYANVVNDGIVPLRTSCLLFLDWRGLGRVEKARRANGLVGTMLEWGWTEMTGQNASAPRRPLHFTDLFNDDDHEPSKPEKPDAETSLDPASSVPQADASQGFDDADRDAPERHQFLDSKQLQDEVYRRGDEVSKPSSTAQANTMWSGFMSLFRPQAGKQKSPPKPKPSQKMYRRGQTTKFSKGSDSSSESSNNQPDRDLRKSLVRGPSLYSAKSGEENLEAPPKTTVFESAGDLLHPPLPPKEFILDPGARPRTIFHDRIYHPDDIPAPPTKRQRTLLRKPPSRASSISSSGQASFTSPGQASSSITSPAARPASQQSIDEVGTMKIEEKIARAYHRDLTWRKVLVCLEPDAHNNMIVRRMFANAYGWPVVQHLCDTHFGYTETAYARDEEIASEERAKPPGAKVHAHGEHVIGQCDPPREEQEHRLRSGSGKGKMPDRAATVDGVSGELAGAAKQEQEEGLGDLVRIRDDLKRGATTPTPTSVNEEPSSASSPPLSADAAPAAAAVKSPNRQSRTASEAREARDEVSEMVSRVNVSGTTSVPGDETYVAVGGGGGSRTNSAGPGAGAGRAALRQLARRDSARWSDRFFEDDEDDEEDEALYVEELRKARARGDYLTREELRIVEGWEAGGEGLEKVPSKAASVGRSVSGNGSGQSASAIGGGGGGGAGEGEGEGEAKAPRKVLSWEPIVAEPGEMVVEGVEELQPSKAAARESSNEAVIDPQILSLTGVGLGKSVEEQVGAPESPTRTKERRGSATGGGGDGDGDGDDDQGEGVAEHVAKLQGKGGENA